MLFSVSIVITAKLLAICDKDWNGNLELERGLLIKHMSWE